MTLMIFSIFGHSIYYFMNGNSSFHFEKNINSFGGDCTDANFPTNSYGPSPENSFSSALRSDEKMNNVDTGNLPSLRIGGKMNIEGLQNYGNTSIPDSRSAVEDILTKNLSSIVQVTIIKNILLDTKVGSKDNLQKNDLAYYNNINNLFDIVNDRTISTDKQILNIYKIMKEVNPGLILPDNNEK
jgi:hypothetical protein